MTSGTSKYSAPCAVCGLQTELAIDKNGYNFPVCINCYESDDLRNSLHNSFIKGNKRCGKLLQIQAVGKTH